MNDSIKIEMLSLKEEIGSYEMPLQRCEKFLENQRETFKEGFKDIEIIKLEINLAKKNIELL